MLPLNDRDCRVIHEIARENSTGEEDESHLRDLLIRGFRLYGTEEMAGSSSSREDFFRSRWGRLARNLPHAGRTSLEAFASAEGRKRLCQIIRDLGAPEMDVEDLAQEMTRKFWSANWAERYNPLVSSWRTFVTFPLKNHLRSYNTRKSKKILTRSLSLNQPWSSSSLVEGASDVGNCLYVPGGIEEDMDKRLFVRELTAEWENFLSVQGSLRSTTYRGLRKLATLLPPGIPELPVEEETEVGYFNCGPFNSRVSTPELYDRGLFYMVPNHLLVDYISVDRDGEFRVDSCTGEYLTQKFYDNPSYTDRIDESIIRKMCTLLPPGVDGYPTTEEKDFYILREEPHRYLVTLPEWRNPGRYLWVDVDDLVTYQAMDEETREPLIHPETGQFLTQSYYINPEYLKVNVGFKIERRLLDVYYYLRDGYQADEIGQIFRVAPSSVPSWVKKLEELFQSFWLISDRIPSDLKILAVRSYQCPGCGRLSRRWRECCSYCGSDTTDEVPAIRLDTYPWSRLYGSRDIMGRYEQRRRQALMVPTCSI